MLKKLKVDDIDNIMQFWKEEVAKVNKQLNKQYFSDEYTKIQNQFIKNVSSTILYTEDDIINGCISINNEDGEIWFIAVKSNIRREGIGSILLESCKKEFDKLFVKLKEEDEILKKFFEKNDLKIIETNEDSKSDNDIIFKWEKNTNKKISLIYFDNSINEEEVMKYNNINYYSIDVKKYVKEHEENKNNVKTYIQLRRKIEEGMKADVVLVYLDYNKYYDFLNEPIKDVAKINNVNLNIIVCEPFSVEGAKKASVISEIEKVYKDYVIHKINSTIDINDDISINQIFQKRSEIVLQRIQKIVANYSNN